MQEWTFSALRAPAVLWSRHQCTDSVTWHATTYLHQI